VSLSLSYAGLSDSGKVRDHNEDAWAAYPSAGLFLVADGMGGQAAGDLAAQTVVATLPELLRPAIEENIAFADPEMLAVVVQAICDLSNTIYEQSHDEPGLDGMGATVVVAFVKDDKALLAHVGDSRAYLLREDHFTQLTTDHSLVQLLVETEELAMKDAKGHPASGQLTRFVGMEGELLPDATILDLQAGDRLLLCTDGLSDMIDDEQIGLVLRGSAPPKKICENLVEVANAAGGQDNVTVIVIEIIGPTGAQLASARWTEIRNGDSA